MIPVFFLFYHVVMKGSIVLLNNQCITELENKTSKKCNDFFFFLFI